MTNDNGIEYEVECEECGETFNTDNQDEAVGWMFGHTMRTGHDDIYKHEV